VSVKAASLHEQEAQERLGKAFGSGDLCMLLVPKEAYSKLSEEAKRRGLTVAELMAAAIDSYLAGEHRPGLNVSATVGQSSGQQMIESGNGPHRPRKLKGFY
jgi:hypothetical protein